MKRFFKRIVCFICCSLAAVGAIQYGPSVGMFLFGNSNTQWISEQFSQTLRDKNELIVYEVETTGRETVSQEAWLIGTVQKVVLPYTFQVRFSLDLSQAKVKLIGNEILVSIPTPQAGYQKLVVEEEQIEKIDWLYPLTPERYAEILNQVEQKLLQNAATNPEFQKNAWNYAVQNLNSLFSAVVDQSLFGETCQIQVLPLE